MAAPGFFEGVRMSVGVFVENNGIWVNEQMIWDTNNRLLYLNLWMIGVCDILKSILFIRIYLGEPVVLLALRIFR